MDDQHVDRDDLAGRSRLILNDRFQVNTFFFFFSENTMIFSRNRKNLKLIPSKDLFFREQHGHLVCSCE